MFSNLLVNHYIKTQWLTWIKQHPEWHESRDYGEVLKRFPKQNASMLRGLFDENGTLQAAAAVHITENPVFLELLLTAPWRKKGSGSRLLIQIVEEAIATPANGAIALGSAPGAVTFYQKFGFTIVRPPLKDGWDTPMRLTPAKAQLLVRTMACKK